MFTDRKDAGIRLGRALADYGIDASDLILGIPKGGIQIGIEASRSTGAVFSILIVRKLPFPDNPESGFGAIAEDGTAFVLDEYTSGIGGEVIERIKEEQQREIDRRLEVLRGGRPLPGMKGRTVVLVDDGLAMGSTMTAAARMCRARGPRRVVVAVPVAGERAVRRLDKEADELIVLEQPPFFRAVAQVYERWHDVDDKEALEHLDTFFGRGY